MDRREAEIVAGLFRVESFNRGQQPDEITLPGVVFERLVNRAELGEARVDALVHAARLAVTHHAAESIRCAGEEPVCPGCRALSAVLADPAINPCRVLVAGCPPPPGPIRCAMAAGHQGGHRWAP